MAFVSRNPNTILNAETAENCVNVEPKHLQVGQEFIGYYKNTYIDSEYNNPCYVFKGKEDGRDYLFYGTTALKREMAYFSQGDLVSIIYQGEKTVKQGKFAGKPFHAWKITGENSWVPTQEFISQLQQEVYNRRLEVQKILASPRAMPSTMQNQYATTQQLQNSPPQLQGFGQPTFVAPVSQTFGAPQNSSQFGTPVKKSTDPFG